MFHVRVGHFRNSGHLGPKVRFKPTRIVIMHPIMCIGGSSNILQNMRDASTNLRLSSEVSDGTIGNLTCS
jgi:hypothetical protein